MSWALVTGASSGMGLIYARKLAERGYNILAVSNQEEELQKTASDIRSDFNVDAVALCRNLAEDGVAEALAEYCDGRGMEVEVLVSNAGMFFFKELGQEDLGKVRTMMSLHMKTPTELCLVFGERMKRRGRGYILNVSSLAAALPTPGITIYSATKAYLKNFGKSMSFEMRPYGVGVTTVCPAAIATPLYKLSPRLMKIGVKIGVINTPEWLVKRALKALFKKKPLIKPGFMNYYLPPLIALLPRGIEDRIWKKLK